MWSLVTFRDFDGAVRAGARLRDGQVVEIPGYEGAAGVLAMIDKWREVEKALVGWDPTGGKRATVDKLLPPLLYPRKVVCAGANYRDHLKEMGDLQVPVGWTPFFFLLPSRTATAGHRDVVPVPVGDGSRPDWEAELAIVIGRGGRNIEAVDAPQHVAGYFAFNDITVRGRLARKVTLAPSFNADWLASKGRDRFAPMGPGMTPAWLVDDPHDLSIRLWRNGELKQDGRTSDMIVNIWDLVAAASGHFTLEPGDVIATGTPAGVGHARGEVLEPGDELRVQVADWEALVNEVVAEQDGAILGR